MRNILPYIFILLPLHLFANGTTKEDSVIANIKVLCFERLNENPLLSNRNIESDVLCESACLVPCSYEERERAFMKNIEGFPHNNVKSVREFTQYFTYQKSENTELLFAIGNEYFPIIEKILKENNLPKELKYLPAAISALNPYYHGENGGKGVWQLSYAHATRYGLTIDNLVDERLNLQKSTHAASLYLKDLYAEYKNWPTAVLAFCSSPALVSKAVSRANNNTEFERIIEFLPENYQNNYYIFRALLFVGENWDREKMPSVTPSLLPPTDAVVTNQKLHIGQVSEVLQIPVDILAELNSSLRKGVILEGNTLYLPLGFANNFRVKQQDIALFKTNIYFEMPKTVAQVNLTPLNAASSATMGPAEQKTVTIKKYHVVKSGETLSRIAQKYNTSVNQLKSWNGLSSSKITIGKKLVVKVTKKFVETPTQEDVSVRQNVTIEDNNEVEFGEGSTTPEPNNTPVIKPNPAPKPPTPTANYTYYTVKSGDTLYSIGKKHGVPYTKIKEWNGLKSDTLKVGQKLKIKK